MNMAEKTKNKIKMTIKTMSKPVTKTWDATSGYKTVTATVIWLIIRAIDLKFPNALSPPTEALILDVASLLGVLGVGDKLYRFISKKLKKKEN